MGLIKLEDTWLGLTNKEIIKQSGKHASSGKIKCVTDVI